MRTFLFTLGVVVVAGAALLPAQTVSRPQVIRVYGSATVAIKPDTARVDLGVVTTAATANAAATQNATQTQAVIDALTKLLGTGADIRTVSYSIAANYTYPSNQSPVLTGFTATNIVEVTTADLAGVGRIIDTAIGAGANRVQGLTFSLKDDTQPRAQALRTATQNARAKADVIAGGLGVRTGIILAVQEGVSTTPISVNDLAGAAAAATPTPIVTGTVDVQATVTLDMQIVQ